MSGKHEKREVRILIDDELYEELRRKAQELGFSDVPSYILDIISRSLTAEKAGGESLERIRSRLERYVQDEINKGLAQIETIRRQVTDIIQRLEELEERVKSIEEHRGPGVSEVEREAKPGKPYKTGIERLRDDKVVFESTLPARIQRDRLFSYFERMGAVVLHLSRERVAVDSEFWKEFKEKLFNRVKTNSEEELKKSLGEKGFMLWKALYEDNMIVYDPKTRSWKPVSEELAK